MQRFQESLVTSLQDTHEEDYLGMYKLVYQRDNMAHAPGISLRALIHEYKHQAMVLFKCALLQPKVKPSLNATSIHQRINQSTDAILRLQMREALHDTVRIDLPHTRASSKIGGCCRP